MARHETIALTSDQIAVVKENTRKMPVGTVVTFTYTKRDTGEVSTRSGVVLKFAGSPTASNAAVWLDTDKGERQFNLYLISNVSTTADWQ